jgi:prolyl-tRNA editing enzyme YbaK/EbsC (Cys-tRNA(Pro) deacylase)
MLSFEEVEPLTGHPVGGLCPFGLKGSPKIFLDESIRRHFFVYPAAGDRYHAFKISPAELEALTGGQWVDVCR